MTREPYDSPKRTRDIPIIPHPDIINIRADIQRGFEELRQKQLSQPGRKMLPEEK